MGDPVALPTAAHRHGAAAMGITLLTQHTVPSHAGTLSPRSGTEASPPRQPADSTAATENVLMREYLLSGAARTLRGRLPWLVTLLLMQSTAALVMRSFEELLDREMVIAYFVPMIVGTGGNAGNQPGVAVTRAMALGRPSAKDMSRILGKEAALGLVTAVALSSIAFLRVVAEYPSDVGAAGCISLTTFLLVNFATVMGAMCSVAMAWMSLDPANGAVPLLTTFTDVCGVLLLCSVSSVAYGLSPG